MEVDTVLKRIETLSDIYKNMSEDLRMSPMTHADMQANLYILECLALSMQKLERRLLS